MNTNYYPKAKETEEEKLDAFKSIFEMIEALEKRITTLEREKEK